MEKLRKNPSMTEIERSCPDPECDGVLGEGESTCSICGAKISDNAIEDGDLDKVAMELGHKFQSPDGRTYEVVDHFGEEKDSDEVYGNVHVDVAIPTEEIEEGDETEEIEEGDENEMEEVPGTHPDDQLVNQPGLAKKTELAEIHKDLTSLATKLDELNMYSGADTIDEFIKGASDVSSLIALAGAFDEMNETKLADNMDRIIQKFAHGVGANPQLNPLFNPLFNPLQNLQLENNQSSFAVPNQDDPEGGLMSRMWSGVKNVGTDIGRAMPFSNEKSFNKMMQDAPRLKQEWAIIQQYKTALPKTVEILKRLLDDLIKNINKTKIPEAVRTMQSFNKYFTTVYESINFIKTTVNKFLQKDTGTPGGPSQIQNLNLDNTFNKQQSRKPLSIREAQTKWNPLNWRSAPSRQRRLRKWLDEFDSQAREHYENMMESLPGFKKLLHSFRMQVEQLVRYLKSPSFSNFKKILQYIGSMNLEGLFSHYNTIAQGMRAVTEGSSSLQEKEEEPKVDGFTYQQYIDAGWTDEQLLADPEKKVLVPTKGEEAKTAPAPAPPPPPATSPKPPSGDQTTTSNENAQEEGFDQLDELTGNEQNQEQSVEQNPPQQTGQINKEQIVQYFNTNAEEMIQTIFENAQAKAEFVKIINSNGYQIVPPNTNTQQGTVGKILPRLLTRRAQADGGASENLVSFPRLNKDQFAQYLTADPAGVIGMVAGAIDFQTQMLPILQKMPQIIGTLQQTNTGTGAEQSQQTTEDVQQFPNNQNKDQSQESAKLVEEAKQWLDTYMEDFDEMMQLENKGKVDSKKYKSLQKDVNDAKEFYNEVKKKLEKIDPNSLQTLQKYLYEKQQEVEQKHPNVKREAFNIGRRLLAIVNKVAFDLHMKRMVKSSKKRLSQYMKKSMRRISPRV